MHVKVFYLLHNTFFNLAYKRTDIKIKQMCFVESNIPYFGNEGTV